MAADAHRQRVQQTEFIWLLTALLMVVAPHLLRMPLWVSVAFLGSVFWRWRQFASAADQGRKWLRELARQLFTLAALGAVFVSFGSLLGRDPGVTLLILLLGLKVVELRTERDFYVTTLLGYFVIVTNFFFSQTVVTALYMILGVVALTAALIRVNDGGRQHAATRLRQSGVLVAEALPIALIAFVLFPRLPGPLWGVPADAHAGLTGLDDSMSPGSISELSQSDEVAFRVLFDAPPPPARELYWRGPVLWRTDGTTWRVRDPLKPDAQPAYVSGAPVTYTVTLEAHNRRWLFTLDAPGRSPEGGLLTADFLALAPKPVNQRRRYRGLSYLQYRLPRAHPSDLLLAQQLPAGRHMRTRALAETWRREQASPRQLVQRALRLFGEEEFYYSLAPGLAEGDPIDHFLFDSRRGFCEHYAAAFVILMRAAGVPARVVTGYQGGELNPFDHHIVVRQQDAHAWAEVWFEGRGWTRIDPTTAISPLRIEQNVQAAMRRAASGNVLDLEDVGYLRRLRRQARYGWDAVNNAWNQMVLGYGPRRQTALLNQFGMDDVRAHRLILLLTGALLLIGLALTALLSVSRRGRCDAAQEPYLLFCRKLARAGVVRRPEEGPVDFARRAVLRCHQRKSDIERITSLYLDARYGSNPRSVQPLRLAVRRFRVPA